MIFLQNYNLSIKDFCIPLRVCFTKIGPAIGWATPSRNCTFLEGNQTFLQKFHNYGWKPTSLQNCAILTIIVHWGNCEIPPNTASQPRNCKILDNIQFFYLEVAQSLWEASPSPSQKYTFFPTSWVKCCMCSSVDRFPPGPRKTNLNAWASPPKAKCKGILWFQDLFLLSGGYMQGSSQKPPTKCHFS